MKKLAIVAAAVMILGSANLSHALSFTDTQFGNVITYNLDITSLGGTNYSAVFTIDVDGTIGTQWWAGSFDFKFDTGSVDDDLTINLAGWSAWDGTNDPALWNGGDSYTFTRQGTGFYLTILAPPAGDENPDYQSGINVSTNGTLATFTFTFTLDGGSPLRTDEIPFQVVYYDSANGSGKIVTNQLSEPLTVPEPGTLLLLGCGLLGLGLMRRRRS